MNDIEGLSLATQIITIYCGIFFISAKPDKNAESFDRNRDFHLSEDGKFLFFVVIAACNLLFLVTWIMKFLEIGRDMIKRMSKRAYVCIFLCGRYDKLETEAAQRAAIAKKERIIANIEDTVLYMAQMKKLYINNIYFEDHNRFMKLLYMVQNERNQIDITEKRNNYYIQGSMSRERKFDPERMAELKDDQELMIMENVPVVMGKQRENATKDGRLRLGPYYKELVKLRQQEEAKAKAN